MTGLVRDVFMLAVGAVAGVIAMYYIAANNPKLVAGWYAKLAAAGKIVGGVANTVSKHV
jgi:hypothetical protein